MAALAILLHFLRCPRCWRLQLRAMFCSHRRTTPYTVPGVLYEVLPSRLVNVTCLDCGSTWAEDRAARDGAIRM